MNGLRLALLASLFVGGATLAAPGMAPVAVPARAAAYALSVDGHEGGWAIGVDVRESARAAGRAVRGGETVSEVTLSLGTELGESVRTWLSQAVNNTDAGHDVAVTEVDASRHPASERSFGGAVRRKVRFPAMEVANTSPVHLELTFAPETATPPRAGGTILTGGRVDRQRRVNANGFSLAIDGLDCKHIARVEPIDFVKSAGGRAPGGPAGHVATVAVVFAVESSDSWTKWHKQMVVDGQGHDGKAEKQGVLEYLDVDGRAVMRLELHDLGIMKLTNERHEAGQPDKMRAEMYVDGAVLSFPRP